MEETNQKRKPDYASLKKGIAVWVNNGQFGEFLSIRLLGMNFNVSKLKAQ